MGYAQRSISAGWDEVFWRCAGGCGGAAALCRGVTRAAGEQHSLAQDDNKKISFPAELLR